MRSRDFPLLRHWFLACNLDNILNATFQLGADLIDDLQRDRFVLAQLSQGCITDSDHISEFDFSHIYARDSNWHCLRLYVMEQVETKPDPCMIRMKDSGFICHHEACNDLFGGR
jgi:hypothetical protein